MTRVPVARSSGSVRRWQTVAELVKVGPHGYIHGWVYVGPDAKDAKPGDTKLTCAHCGKVIHHGQYWVHEQNSSDQCPVAGVGTKATPDPAQMKYLGDNASSLDDLVTQHHLSLGDAEGVVSYFRQGGAAAGAG